MSDPRSPGSVKDAEDHHTGAPKVKSSHHIFLVRPGARAAPYWPISRTTWGHVPPLLTWNSLMDVPGTVRSTEMGVDLPTPVLPPVPVGSSGGFPQLLEIDLGVQVVCLTPGHAWDEPPLTVGFLMAPRSSISKRGLRLTNGVGAIDPTYRGNLRARFDVHESYSGTKPGDALLQVLTPDGGGANLIVVGPDAPPSVLALFDTASTERGAGAFGSTGASGTTGEMSGAGGAGGSP